MIQISCVFLHAKISIFIRKNLFRKKFEFVQIFINNKSSFEKCGFFWYKIRFILTIIEKRTSSLIINDFHGCGCVDVAVLQNIY